MNRRLEAHEDGRSKRRSDTVRIRGCTLDGLRVMGERGGGGRPWRAAAWCGRAGRRSWCRRRRDGALRAARCLPVAGTRGAADRRGDSGRVKPLPSGVSNGLSLRVRASYPCVPEARRRRVIHATHDRRRHHGDLPSFAWHSGEWRRRTSHWSWAWHPGQCGGMEEKRFGDSGKGGDPFPPQTDPHLRDVSWVRRHRVTTELN